MTVIKRESGESPEQSRCCELSFMRTDTNATDTLREGVRPRATKPEDLPLAMKRTSEDRGMSGGLTLIMTRRSNIRVTAATLCACLAASTITAAAQGDTIGTRQHELGNIDVVSSRKAREIKSTAPLHVLTQEQFTRLGVTDIADALHRLPGVTLRDYGGAGGLKTVSVRGFGAQHTGVSYDGVMLSECQSGEIDVSRYSLDNIANLSLVIGDNDDIFIPARHAASAATLTIQTVAPPSADTRPHITAQIKAGSFGHVSPFIRYEQSLSKHFSFSAVGEYVYAENDYPFVVRNVSVVTRERRSNSRMSQGHGEMNFVWSIDRQNRLSGKAYYYDNDRQLPGQVRYYTNLSREQLHDRNAFAQLQYTGRRGEHWAMKWNAKFNWAASEYTDGLYKNGVKDAGYWQREAYTSVCLLYAPAPQWAFDYSADYSYNNLTSSLSTDTRPFRHTILQSATAKYTAGRVTAMARLLHSLYLNDAEDGPGARNMRRLSPSVSLSYRLLNDRELYLRTSYKNIFRAPTFNESYFFHYGSTDLLPESTDQWNVGATWRTTYGNGSSIRLTADGYLNHVKDKIVAVPYNMFVWTNINVGKVLVRGIDATISAEHRFGRPSPAGSKGTDGGPKTGLHRGHALLFTANYSYQRAENRTNPESPYYKNQLAYIPEHSGSAALSYENPWLNMSFHGTAVSRRHANNEHYEGTGMARYAEFGITAYRHLAFGRHRFELRADAKNIFNRHYEVVARYPMPGRNYMFSVCYKL